MQRALPKTIGGFLFLLFLNHGLAARFSESTPRCVLHLESPDYPELLRAARVFGTAVLRVRVDPAGRVESVEKLSGPEALASLAEGNARTWEFAPGEPTTLEIRYEFRLDEPGTFEKVVPKVVFDLPSHVLVVSRERETNRD
jgi:TonB family protein